MEEQGMNPDPWSVYELILGQVERGEAERPLRIDQFVLGLTWTCCRIQGEAGFAQSPGMASRVLQFPGTVADRSAAEVAAWLKSWDPFAATAGLAAANAVINSAANPLLHGAQVLEGSAPANLAVFEHFRAQLFGKQVVVIGRYPGLDDVLDGLDVSVIERQPGTGDLPDPAAEFLLPQADWVFLTATSLINKTFPRLVQLAKNAVTVLMGPSAPWLAELAAYDIDFLAGVVPVNVENAVRIAAEGGGTRLFGDGVRYAVADIGTGSLNKLTERITQATALYAELNQAMQTWYANGTRERFPRYAELEQLSVLLADLESAYKRQWDARNGASA